MQLLGKLNSKRRDMFLSTKKLKYLPIGGATHFKIGKLCSKTELSNLQPGRKGEIFLKNWYFLQH